MLARQSIVAATLLAGAAAQTTYTGCHMHGSISYCYDSEGVELAVSTVTTPISTAVTVASVAATPTAEPQTTAITSCHMHATDLYCMDGYGDEVLVSMTGTTTSPPPAQFTDCRAHGEERYCVDPEGNDVAVLSASDEGHDHSHGEEQPEEGELDCHFHAGVE